MINDHTKFKSFTSYSNTSLSDRLEIGLKSWMDWAFLGIGAFVNVSGNQPTLWSNDLSKLRWVSDPNFANGRVWETARSQWIYETGIEFTGATPTRISGVYIDGTFYGSGDATYGHYFDFNRGRVIFDSPIATTSTVKMDYAYRSVQVYVAHQSPWWQQLQYNSYRVDDSHFNVVGSGDWSILSKHRVQMPAIVIEIIPRRRFRPYEMGNKSLYVFQDIDFNILAESKHDRDRLMDIISLQEDHSVWMYDVDKAIKSGVLPLDFRGMVTGPDLVMYPVLVTGSGPNYRWKSGRFTNTQVFQVETNNPTLHEAKVRSTIDIVYGTI